MRLPTEQHHCCGCAKTTEWVKHASYEQCSECRTRFPCAKCDHFDCREARGEATACEECRYFDTHAPSCKKSVDSPTPPQVESPT